MTTRERELECVIADLTDECKRLRGELEEAKVTRGNSVLVPSDELKRMRKQLAAKDATIEKLRAHLKVIAGLQLCADNLMSNADIAAQALAATQDDAAILRSHASDIDVANRIEEIALALDGYFSYERGLDPYIDELNKLAAKIRNGETDAT